MEHLPAEPEQRAGRARWHERSPGQEPAPPPTSVAPFDGAVRLTPAPENVGCRWNAGPSGAGALTLVYLGPLARREEVHVRFGLQRQGGVAWSEIRELPLRREGAQGCIATLDVPAGLPVEAVQLAFRSGDRWDNGGRAPLGYYEWRPGEATVAAVG